MFDNTPYRWGQHQLAVLAAANNRAERWRLRYKTARDRVAELEARVKELEDVQD